MFSTIAQTARAFTDAAGTYRIVAAQRAYCMDCDTALAIFARLDRLTAPAFLLESVEGGEHWARYSFMGFGALAEIEGFGQSTRVRYGDGETRTLPAGLSGLRELLAEMAPEQQEAPVRFGGGMVGYLSYDAVRYFENLPEAHPDPGARLFRFVVPEILCVHDTLRKQVHLIAFANPSRVARGAAKDAASALERRLDEVEAVLRSDNPGRLERCLRYPLPTPPDAVPLSVNIGRPEFLAAVERAKEYIRAGDVFQVVVSQRFSARGVALSALEVYRRLRIENPSPYLFYLHFDDERVIGASPEVLVRLTGGLVEVRPIAGTRRRGQTPLEDEALEQELLADPKEVAEHVMLLDLGRNDLGRVCRIGTIAIPDRMVVERYSKVMHLVSHVRGELDEGLDWLDVLGATFPAGTLTGAPKIRAMEIIDELEPTRRHLYGGAVGYIGFDGNMDLCIAIRTLHVRGEEYAVQVGAGIVADSVPESEFEETVNKGLALFRAIGAQPPDAAGANGPAETRG